MIITDFFGPPIVPTPKKIIIEVFNKIYSSSSSLQLSSEIMNSKTFVCDANSSYLNIKPKKEDLLIDLGSGSGRVIRLVAKKYGVKGLGIEINPFLVLWSRLRALFDQQKNIEFKRQNYLKADLSKADIIFMYLLPKNIPPVVEKIEKEGKKGVLVVSQRFFVDKWNKYLVNEMSRKNNSSFVYRL